MLFCIIISVENLSNICHVNNVNKLIFFVILQLIDRPKGYHTWFKSIRTWMLRNWMKMPENSITNVQRSSLLLFENKSPHMNDHYSFIVQQNVLFSPQKLPWNLEHSLCELLSFTDFVVKSNFSHYQMFKMPSFTSIWAFVFTAK